MRQANNTIKGYIYQFNKSIYEILSADDEASVVLEGAIEDIDVLLPDTTIAVQCKYHEDSKFSISTVATPILEMLCHFNECAALGKRTKYILYAHYSENVDSIDVGSFKAFLNTTTNKDIQLNFFHRIFTIKDASILSLANKDKKKKEEKEELLSYYSSHKSELSLCVNVDAFWELFKYENAFQFDALKNSVIDKLISIANDRETAEALYYPNAFSLVANISARESIEERTINKADFIQSLINQKSVLITRWLLIALDRKKILHLKRQSLSAYFSLNTAVRSFVFSSKFISANTNTIFPFVQEYLTKYFRKKTLHKQPIFILENEETTQNIILNLHKYQKTVNSGLVGNSFQADSFINNTDCSQDFVCKIASLEKIDATILESCNTDQLFIIGKINKSLENPKYYTEQLDINSISELRYLVKLTSDMEV